MLWGCDGGVFSERIITVCIGTDGDTCRHVGRRTEGFRLFLTFRPVALGDSAVGAEVGLRLFHHVTFELRAFSDGYLGISLECVFDAFRHEKDGVDLSVEAVKCVGCGDLTVLLLVGILIVLGGITLQPFPVAFVHHGIVDRAVATRDFYETRHNAV